MNNVKKRKVMSSSAEADIENMALSGEQKEVMRFALTGRSFFFTGAAGCGKSHLMRQLVAMLRKSHDYSEIQVTAPTGIGTHSIPAFLSRFPFLLFLSLHY
jgi:DNA replication protein DnaC